MSNKAWSFLFGIVMALCFGLFLVAPAVGWWLPEAGSSHASEIDGLFYMILAITGFFFVLTEALLIIFMYRYAEGEAGDGARGPSVYWKFVQPLAKVLDTSSKVEMAWTLVPAVILLFLAFTQVNTWAAVKYKSRLEKIYEESGDNLPVHVDMSARQFEWRFRYPHPDTYRAFKNNPAKAKKWLTTPNFDDIKLPNELHVVLNRHCVVNVHTKDVLHSFNIPHMRIKQDTLPGKEIPVWFKPIVSNVTKVKDEKTGKVIGWLDGGGRDENGKPVNPKMVWDIACAELCGWGHYRMVGKLYVHETEEDFLAWLEDAAARQFDYGAQAAPAKN